MKTKLIEALKKTIDDLKFNRKEYNWTDVQSCNCGLLAANVTDRKFRDIAGWSIEANLCKKTGKPVHLIFQDLTDIGMSYDDVTDFEFLANPAVITEAGISPNSLFPYIPLGSSKEIIMTNLHNDKLTVILYMEAWVRILEREGAAQIPEIKEEEKPKESNPLSIGLTYKQMKEVNELLLNN